MTAAAEMVYKLWFQGRIAARDDEASVAFNRFLEEVRADRPEIVGEAMSLLKSLHSSR